MRKMGLEDLTRHTNVHVWQRNAAGQLRKLHVDHWFGDLMKQQTLLRAPNNK